MHHLPEFADEWPLYQGRDAASRRAYLVSEIRRLAAEGAPILSIVLAQLDDLLRESALELVRQNDDGAGNLIFEHRTWAVRLIEGEAPPDVDPQGRPIPPGERGKVLVVKVGNLGGDVKPTAEASEVMQYSGPQRLVRAQSGRNLYRTVKIGRAPVALSFDDAVAALRQWGVGVGLRKYRRAKGAAIGRAADAKGQCLWLLEEVVPEVEAPAPAAPEKPRQRAA